MIGKQLINGLVEYGIPYICSRRCGRNPEKENVKQWMIDHRLNKFDWKMLVPEYLEMSKENKVVRFADPFVVSSSDSIWFCYPIRHGISVSNDGIFYRQLASFCRYSLAPLFALMNNLVELRFDAWKILTRFRRPVLYKAANIGVWTNILSTISYLAVLTNVRSFLQELSESMIVFCRQQLLHGHLNSFPN